MAQDLSSDEEIEIKYISSEDEEWIEEDFRDDENIQPNFNEQRNYGSYDDLDQIPHDILAFRPERPPGAHFPDGVTRQNRRNYLTPLSIFKLFFTEALVEMLCKFNNEIAAATGPTKPSMYKNWKDIDFEEFYVFMGLLMYMGLVQVPNFKLYWNGKSLFNDLWARAFMTRFRFQQILCFLKVSNRDTEVATDKLAKLASKASPTMMTTLTTSQKSQPSGTTRYSQARLNRGFVQQRANTIASSENAEHISAVKLVIGQPPQTAQGHAIHVRKVWSPPVSSVASPSPTPVSSKSGISFPSSETELKKAYFRQLDEIKNLQEQLQLKDKRIQQLETELAQMKEREADLKPGETCYIVPKDITRLGSYNCFRACYIVPKDITRLQTSTFWLTKAVTSLQADVTGSLALVILSRYGYCRLLGHVQWSQELSVFAMSCLSFWHTLTVPIHATAAG
ncbi:coronin-1A [Biomphalaria pfeifferi]|uniref:Coronin-1A n=1 Tax=Biomphalaria pfeifferi TaxID=112525 RepID=A0AAD8C7D6_BIOPF|nr:coronin-1A [Biomphalaria pfeifferi]